MKTIGRVALFPVKFTLFAVGLVAFSFAYWYLADLLPVNEQTPGYYVIFVALLALWAWVLAGWKKFTLS